MKKRGVEHMKKTRLTALILALVMLFSCSTAFAAKDTFNFIGFEPVTLNALESNSNLDAFVFYLTSAMLYRTVNGEVIPELCESLEVSEDRTTYTYTIKDAAYSDGTPITAQDFVYYMIKRGMTSETAHLYLGGSETYENSLDTCEGIYAIDEKTFVVTLVEPTTVYEECLEIYPINADFVAEKGAAYGGSPADLQYSGPYIMTAWTVGAKLTFEKNPDYIFADTLFPVQYVNMILSSVNSTTYSLYTSGEVDMIASVNDELYEMLGGEDCVWFDASSVNGIEFNTTGFTYKEGDGFVSRGEDVTALMQNKNFRLALCYALDRELIVEAIDPSGTATNRFVHTFVDGLTEGMAYVDEYQYSSEIPLNGDYDLAVEYLNKALEELGYSDVSELPQLTYLTFDSEAQKLMGETIVAEWGNVLGLKNITINLQPMMSAIMSMVYMDYDIYWQMLSTNPDQPFEFLAYWTTTGSVSDVAGFQQSGAPAFMTSMHANAEYDALINALYTEFDQATYFDTLLQAEEMFYNDLIYFPVLSAGTYYAIKDNVEGYVNCYEQDGYDIAYLVVND